MIVLRSITYAIKNLQYIKIIEIFYTIFKFLEGEWSEWSVCSKECGGGERTRTMKRSTKFLSRLTSFQDSLDNGVLKESCNTQSCEGI